jgi:hypothetical protein
LPVEIRKKIRSKKDRHSFQVERALDEWNSFLRDFTETASAA